ncbi:MAG: hypothetical protein L0Y36_10650 [Planctomycetales bacterium]|nr:hypothetical protein [Planctomycetales bacterium]
MNMLFIKCLRNTLFIFSALVLVGCSHQKDMYPYQPLVKPPNTVEGILKQEPYTPESFASELVGKSSPPSRLWWKVSFLTSYKADKIVDICLDYLAKIGASPQVISIPIEQWPNDTRYPWLWFDRALSSRTAYYDNSGNLKVKNHNQSGFDTIKTIVCLKPLVVIKTKGLIIDGHYSGAVYITRHSPQLKEIFDRFGTYTLCALKHGFAYGTHIPYAENPLWFSPDMGIPPRPVEIDENGTGHIPLPWGELVLTKQADEWIVMAKTI